MFDYGDLPANLAAFCAVLRRDHAFRIGTRELHDAARAMTVVEVADERVVRNALRPVLASSFEHAVVFDDAFRRFFHGQWPGRPLERPTTPKQRDQGDTGEDDAASRQDGAVDDDPESRDTAIDRESVAAVEDEDATDEPTLRVLRSAYSPLAGEAPAPRLHPPDADWLNAARALRRRMQAMLSRRWRPALRGTRFDLRRTLRHSLHTAGEPVLPRWQARPRLQPRVVALIDGSRSMSEHVDPALKTAVALAAAIRNFEAFTFSTTLARVTADVRRAAAGEHRRLPPLHHAWGGGTSIGGSLREFTRRYGERLLGRHTLVIVASDGLDVGAADVLRDAMAAIHRRSAGIVWLNPLLRTAGYEPTASGMRVARRYVTCFTSVSEPADLLRLADGLRRKLA